MKQFVIDFYAPEVRLAIELDGAVHFTDEAQLRDAETRNLDFPLRHYFFCVSPMRK